MALSNAERQRLYIQRLKAKAAAVTNSKRSEPRNSGYRAQPLPPTVTNNLSTHARAMLKRLARYRECSAAALIERLVTAEEHRVVARLKGKPKVLNRYYDGG